MIATIKWLTCVLTATLAWSEADAFPSVWKRDATSRSDTVSGICNTSICQQDATEILESLDRSVDPCDDFYMFACGGWIKKHPATKDTPTVSHSSKVPENVMAQVKLTLEGPISEDDISPLKAAKKMYQVCMDVETIERTGIQPLVDLSNEFGGWPMALEDWDNDGFNVESTLAEFSRRLFWSPLFYTSANYFVDDNNKPSLHVNIQNIDIGLSRTELFYPSEEKTRAAYKQIIADVALEIRNATGVIKYEEYVLIEANLIVEFMKELKNISSEDDTSEKEMTLKELQKWTDTALIFNAYAEIDWLSYLNKILSDTDIVLDEDEIVFVKDRDYLLKLVKLLGVTSPRVIGNYLQWMLISSYKDITTKRMIDLSYYPKEGIPRSSYCSEAVMKRFNHVINSQIVPYLYNDEDKKQFHALVYQIQSQFVQEMRNSWLEGDALELLIQKVEALKVYSGYPEDIYNNASALTHYYRKVNITNNHFNNMLIRTPNFYMCSLLRLRDKIVDVKDIWENARPEWPRAVFTPISNSVQFVSFTFGILQYFFRMGRMKALNYGRIGMIAGHEMMHSFSYNYLKGNWSKETSESVDDRHQCFIDQYNKFHIPELEKHSNKSITVNGKKTLHENTADTTGLAAAYNAYMLVGTGPEESLPGLEEYSNSQMFFIGAATAYCESHTSDTMETYQTDNHAPKYSRVGGSVSNNENFATAFNCPAGSNMNPGNKCRMFDHRPRPTHDIEKILREYFGVN